MSNIIDSIQLSGVTYGIKGSGGTETIELTQAEYDALVDKDPTAFYIITDATAGDLTNYYTKTETNTLLDDKVETSAITTSVTSSSTDAQVPSAKAVNDKLGGLSLVKLTQAEYDALATKDNSTLYVIVN